MAIRGSKTEGILWFGTAIVFGFFALALAMWPVAPAVQSALPSATPVTAVIASIWAAVLAWVFARIADWRGTTLEILPGVVRVTKWHGRTLTLNPLERPEMITRVTLPPGIRVPVPMSMALGIRLGEREIFFPAESNKRDFVLRLANSIESAFRVGDQAAGPYQAAPRLDEDGAS